jgi:hypothetical protein
MSNKEDSARRYREYIIRPEFKFCGPGQFSRNGACTTCLPDTYAKEPGERNACTKCPDGSTSSSTFVSCTSLPGYCFNRDTLTFKKCDPGTFSAANTDCKDWTTKDPSFVPPSCEPCIGGEVGNGGSTCDSTVP